MKSFTLLKIALNTTLSIAAIVVYNEANTPPLLRRSSPILRKNIVVETSIISKNETGYLSGGIPSLFEHIIKRASGWQEPHHANSDSRGISSLARRFNNDSALYEKGTQKASNYNKQGKGYAFSTSRNLKQSTASLQTDSIFSSIPVNHLSLPAKVTSRKIDKLPINEGSLSEKIKQESTATIDSPFTAETENIVTPEVSPLLSPAGTIGGNTPTAVNITTTPLTRINTIPAPSTTPATVNVIKKPKFEEKIPSLNLAITQPNLSSSQSENYSTLNAYSKIIDITLDWIKEDSLLSIISPQVLAKSIPVNLHPNMKKEIIHRLSSLKPNLDLAKIIEEEVREKEKIQRKKDAICRRSGILEKRIRQRDKDLQLINRNPLLAELEIYYKETNDYQVLLETLTESDIEKRDILFTTLIRDHPTSKQKRNVIDNYIYNSAADSYKIVLNEFNQLISEDQKILLRSHTYRILINSELIADSDYNISIIKDLCSLEILALLYKMKLENHHIKNPTYLKRFSFYNTLEEKAREDLHQDISDSCNNSIHFRRKKYSEKEKLFAYLPQQKHLEQRAMNEKKAIKHFAKEKRRNLINSFQKLTITQQHSLTRKEEFRTYNAAYLIITKKYPSEKKKLEALLLNDLTLKDLTHEELISLQYAIESSSYLLDIIKTTKSLQHIYQNILERTKGLYSIISPWTSLDIEIKESKQFVDESPFRKLREITSPSRNKQASPMEEREKKETEETSGKISPPPPPPPPPAFFSAKKVDSSADPRALVLNEILKKAQARNTKISKTIPSATTDAANNSGENPPATLEALMNAIVEHLQAKYETEQEEQQLEDKLKAWGEGYGNQTRQIIPLASKKDSIEARLDLYKLQQDYCKTPENTILANKIEKTLEVLDSARRIEEKREESLYSQALMPIRNRFLKILKDFYINNEENARELAGAKSVSEAIKTDYVYTSLLQCDPRSLLSKEPEIKTMKVPKNPFINMGLAHLLSQATFKDPSAQYNANCIRQAAKEFERKLYSFINEKYKELYIKSIEKLTELQLKVYNNPVGENRLSLLKWALQFLNQSPSKFDDNDMENKDINELPPPLISALYTHTKENLEEKTRSRIHFMDKLQIAYYQKGLPFVVKDMEALLNSSNLIQEITGHKVLLSKITAFQALEEELEVEIMTIRTNAEKARRAQTSTSKVSLASKSSPTKNIIDIPLPPPPPPFLIRSIIDASQDDGKP